MLLNIFLWPPESFQTLVQVMIFFNTSGKDFKFCFDGIPLGRHCMGSRHLEGPVSQNTYSCCRWTRAQLNSGTLPAWCSTPPADCWGPSPAASHSAGSARSCTTGSASTRNTPCPPDSSLSPSSQTSTSTEPSWAPCSLNNDKIDLFPTKLKQFEHWLFINECYSNKL